MPLTVVIFGKIVIGLVGVAMALMFVGGVKNFVQDIRFKKNDLLDVGQFILLSTASIVVIVAAVVICIS